MAEVSSFVILRFFLTFSNSFFPHNNYKLGRYPGTEWILHISSLLFLYIVLINSVFQFTPFYLKKTHIKSSFSMHFLFHKRVGRPPVHPSSLFCWNLNSHDFLICLHQAPLNEHNIPKRYDFLKGNVPKAILCLYNIKFSMFHVHWQRTRFSIQYPLLIIIYN